MKKLHLLIIATTLLYFSSCSPKISTSLTKNLPPIDYKQEIIVIGLNQLEPDNFELLGEVKVEDTGFSNNCSYNIVIDKAKLEARKAGGNAIKIIKHKQPSTFGSSCHQIIAKILLVDNIKDYKEQVEEDSLLDVDYAILNIYRYGGPGFLVNYNLYLGDSIICRVKNNFKTTLYIKKDGINSLWAKTEVKTEIPINIKMGKTYYVLCGISAGALVGHPTIEIVDNKSGKLEFASFKANNK